LPKLAPQSPKRIRARFVELGWIIVPGSKHNFAVKDTRKVRLPNIHGGDISVGLLRRILNQAGISRSEWLDS
jgi:predicted RNA binding protein YcfA (HicA-like mRNA interferase family)